MLKFIQSLFQSWNYLGKRKVYGTRVSFFFPELKDDIEATILFYEKPSGKRKIMIIGVQGWMKKEFHTIVQPLVWDWLNGSGQLPVGVELNGEIK